MKTATSILILRLAIPLLFLFVSLAYWTLRDKVIPPFGENLLIYGLLGLAVKLVTDPIPAGMNLSFMIIIIILSVIAAFFYIIIFRIQRDMTEERIEEILKASKNQIDRDILRELGKRLVDPDFIENSGTNAISGFERKKARKFFADLINAVYGKQITQEDLLVPDRKKHWTTKANIVLSIFSGLVFIISLIFNITIFFTSVQNNLKTQ